MKLNTLDKINYANILLMMLCAALAIFIPFQLFLFAYAILGPLHYLTEISWLHDKNYYTQKKYDWIFLAVLSFVIALPIVGPLFHFKTNIEPEILNRAIYLAVIASVIFVMIKKALYRIIAFAVALITISLSDNFYLLLSVFLPTLLHVFGFTALFVLYGALKSKSKSGYYSFVVMIVCPIILFAIPAGITQPFTSSFGLTSYQSFEALNFFTLKDLFHTSFNGDNYFNNIYRSNNGVLLMRVIAFAYTYHYLNWFSKTKVIRWHEVPLGRIVLIFILWLASIGAYAYNYKLGFECLFFLSFTHVLLELPLNVVSIRGICQELTGRTNPRQLTTKTN